MTDYCACGDLKKRMHIPACKDCFEIWGDVFKTNSGVECEIGDVTGGYEDDAIFTWNDGVKEKYNNDTLLIIHSR